VGIALFEKWRISAGFRGRERNSIHTPQAWPKLDLQQRRSDMHPEIIFYTVAAVTVLSGAAASLIALTSSRPEAARMAVALKLARIALIGATALAALLSSSVLP
jgi:hypothetical protein